MNDNGDNKSLTLVFGFGMMMAIFFIISSNSSLFKPYYQSISNYINGQIGSINGENTNYQSKAPKTTVDYDAVQEKLSKQREQLASAYQAANTASKKQVLIEQARGSFIASITTLLPYWYGTPWNFNGTSEKPQQGNIACGYYVSTILRDSGLEIERVKLAQQASENIIKSLTNDTYIKRFSGQSIEEFLAVVDDWGEGLYVVGLDYHVGYLWHDGEQMHFIHASALPPRRAISEPALTSPALTNSRYRVIGKISDDDKLIEKWLLQTKISTTT